MTFKVYSIAFNAAFAMTFDSLEDLRKTFENTPFTIDFPRMEITIQDEEEADW